MKTNKVAFGRGFFRVLNSLILSIVILGVFSLNAYAAIIFSDVDEELAHINALLADYAYEEAYARMLQFLEIQKDESETEAYVSVLAKTVNIESFYWIHDKMLMHAGDLYKLTENRDLWRYRVEALEAFAYYDYYNYDNAKALEKYTQLQSYALSVDPSYEMPQYYTGMALLAIDEQAYDKALEFLNQALIQVELPHGKSLINAPQKADIIQIKAEIATYRGEKTLAADLMQASYDAIDPTDFERLTSKGITLVQYLMDADKIDLAESYFKDVSSHYEKTGDLYRANIEATAMLRLEAQLAYAAGDYQKSADLFKKVTTYKAAPENVEKTIAANAAASQFEFETIQQQMDLLDQLKIEQSQRIALQQRNLMLAYVTIAIMVVLILSALFTLAYQIKQRQRLYSLSITDQLTQLFNRSKIIETFDQIQTHECCVALLDLDHFKRINDTYGHHVGDLVLKGVSECMKGSLRLEDQIGRYGGEEFMAIIRTSDIEVAREICERVRKNVEALEWPYPDIKTTLSIGLVYSEKISGDILLSEADRLLYLAKDSGRNQVQSLILL